jgi:hypothetical protein
MQDYDHRGGFHGARDYHRESTVNFKYRQWSMFDGPPPDFIWEQLELPFPVDPLEAP